MTSMMGMRAMLLFVVGLTVAAAEDLPARHHGTSCADGQFGTESSASDSECIRSDSLLQGNAQRFTSLVEPAYYPDGDQEYSIFKLVGWCCKTDAIWAGDLPNTTECIKLCTVEPLCLYLDYSNKHGRCHLCADCDDDHMTLKSYKHYASWQKVTPAPTPQPTSQPTLQPTPQPTPAPTAEPTYTLFKSAGWCCKKDAIWAGDVPKKEDCKKRCSDKNRCLYFDHSNKRGRCRLCADCDDDYKTNSDYKHYTSWQKVTPPPTPQLTPQPTDTTTATSTIWGS